MHLPYNQVITNFEQTWWSQIERAGSGDQDALSQIVERYRDPVFRFIHSKGLGKEDADDLTQEVFLRILRLDILKRADQSRGRFRSMLLTVTENVINSGWTREKAQKRGGGATRRSIEDVDIPEEVLTRHSTEDTFDAGWAKNLLQLALHRIKEKHGQYHEAISLSLEGLTHAEIARRLKCTTKDVANRVHRGREKLREFVQAEVRQYCSSTEEYSQELQIADRAFRGLKEATDSGP